MAIYLDRPQWWWRGRRWSHLISDTSLDELHAFARTADLRYLSFGRDHYDVPEDLFEHCQSLGAELVDPRDIVRMLRQAGLREGRGKSFKRWRSTSRANVAAGADPAALKSIDRVGAAAEVSASDAEWLTRPGELVVLFEVEVARPDVARRLPAVADLDGVERIVTTTWNDSRYIEVVVPLQSSASP